MAITVGIVGLPNVGKSTLFNALSSAGAESANFPFCTIEPNVGMVSVPDPRLDVLAKIFDSQKIISTTMEFVDIAGLVKGASAGEGLGNQFLGHIRAVDAIAHVVRCFEDDNIVHVHGAIDAGNDVEVIDTELAIADLESVEKKLSKALKQSRASGAVGLQAKAEATVLELLQGHLTSGKPARTLADEWTDDQHIIFNDLHLLTAKPVLFIANVSEDDAADASGNAQVTALKKHAESVDAEMVVISGAIEAEVAELEEAERLEFLESLGLKEPGLNPLIRAAYKLLGLQTYLTAGPKESRAWTVKVGATAPQAAGVIHSDFERGFIRAEVTALDDLVAAGSEAAVKAAGKLRVEGKDYIVQDGDVIHFRFNV